MASIIVIMTVLTTISNGRSIRVRNDSCDVHNDFQNTIPKCYIRVGSHNIGISLHVDTITNMLDMIISGPSDKYFGIGFGSGSMESTYSIIMNGGIEEYKLTKNDSTQSNTSLSTQMITINSDTINSTSNTRIVSITRKRIGISTDHYTFINDIGTISLIAAVGSSSNIEYHASNRNSTSIDLIQWCGGCGYYRKNITVGSENIYIELFTDFNSDNTTISLIGPANKYFGVGFGSLTMDGTYGIIVDSQNVAEYQLSNSCHGQSQNEAYGAVETRLPSQMQTITVHYDGTDNTSNTRTVSMTRPRIGAASVHYTFPNEQTSIPVIVAVGSNSTVDFHGLNNAQTFYLSAETFETLIPTSQPTVNPTTTNIGETTKQSADINQVVSKNVNIVYINIVLLMLFSVYWIY